MSPPQRSVPDAAGWGVALVLVVLTLGLYGPVVHFTFLHYDDPHYVVLQPKVSQGLSLANVRWSLTAFEVGNWHPLTLMSHMADVSLFGMRAGAHHAMNVLFHALNAGLLFLFLDASTRRRWPSLFAAALFSVHPLNVESVAWISQRKSVLCLFFLLLSMSAYVAWTRRRAASLYAMALVACGAALMCKPMAVVLPVLLLLLDYWPLGRTFRAVWILEKVPFAGLAVGASVATWMAQSEGGAVGTLTDHPAMLRLAYATFAYGWYLMRMVWPSDLSLFYPTTLGSWAGVKVLGSAVVVVTVTVVALRSWRLRPYLAMGWGWYGVALAPVIGLVTFGTQIVADRYAYLALIGPFVAVSFLGADLLQERSERTRRFGMACGAAVVLALAFGTGYALAPWRDSLTILQRGVARAPDNVHAIGSLGWELVEHGRYDEGIALLKRAVDTAPLFGTVRANLGSAYARAGRLSEARATYEEALRERPSDGSLNVELGRVLAKQGLQQEAESKFREAVRDEPDNGEAWLFLGTLLSTQGGFDEAERVLERAVALLPRDARPLTVQGVTLAALGRRDEAIAALRKAVTLDPGFARARTELDRIEGKPAGE